MRRRPPGSTRTYTLCPYTALFRSRAAGEKFNEQDSRQRRGVGIGCVWYGCGNTSMSNPSTIAVALDRKGKLTLYNGAVDLGPGSNTVMAQNSADALGLQLNGMRVVLGEPARPADAGTTTTTRQAFHPDK